jgi:hypothetical protein
MSRNEGEDMIRQLKEHADGTRTWVYWHGRWCWGILQLATNRRWYDPRKYFRIKREKNKGWQVRVFWWSIGRITKSEFDRIHSRSVWRVIDEAS